jgi:hypothetical protein
MPIDSLYEDPRAGFNHLNIPDLLAAREQYHVFLTRHPNVVGTAIGRYLIRKPGVDTTKGKGPKPPRTLGNSHVDLDKSWPCVLVFVDLWQTDEELIKANSPAAVIPKTLYLPDGRAVPVCVVEAPRQAEPTDAPMARKLAYPKSVIAGGFPLEVTVQGVDHIATVGCLVTDGSRYYGLTSRHVCGEPGRIINARIGGELVPIGVTASRELQLSKLAFSTVYPDWSGAHLFVNADIGLIDLNDVNRWRTDIYQLGQLGPIADFNVNNLTLSMVGKEVCGFGAGSGPIEGQVSALFYRYRSMGGIEYISDFLIGPTGSSTTVVRHGDSGAILCLKTKEGFRPLATIWGAHEFVDNGTKSALGYGLATGLGNVCRLLDIDIVRGWNIDQPYTWGKTGHFKIGFHAADLVGNKSLSALLATNQASLGYPNHILESPDSVNGAYTDDFVPLADVADVIWRTKRPSDESNHFCDIDETHRRVYGGKSLMELSFEDEANIDPSIWLDFDQKMDAVKPIYKMNRKTHEEELRPREGALPFRVWQMYLQMIASLAAGRMDEYLVAGGTMAHYVGDACQPLHISYLHHGADESESAVHSDYETTLIDRKASELFTGVDANKKKVKQSELIDAEGRSAAKLVLGLMKATVGRLSPEEVLEVWRKEKGQGKYDRMWDALGPQTIENISEGAHVMAVLWQSAWKHGNGDRLPETKLGKIAKSKLQVLYLKRDFVQSFRLSDIENYREALGLPVEVNA